MTNPQTDLTDQLHVTAPSPGGEGRVAAVTGANGYVGTIICEGLSEAGFSVRRLIRRPEPGTPDRTYDIESGCAPGALDGVDVLVHCAYDFSVRSRAAVWRTNVLGTRSLLDQALASGVTRTVVVSSMSAYPGTRQIYGRSKLATELDAFARGMTVIRPGLVYGPGWGGMAGTLRKLVALPVVPVVGGHSHQFTLHEDDLRTAVVAIASAPTVPGRPLGLAHPEPVTFAELLRAIARVDGGREPRLLPLPWPPVYWSMRLAEMASLPIPVRADSMLGLVKPAPLVPNAEDVRALGINLRPLTLGSDG
jgi:nucleoside-diphosphate-sugar epimerase